MNQKLKALLVASGMAVIGGVTFLVASPKPGVVRAELLDAGIDESCDPVEVSCQGRDLCQSTLADGGLSRRYRTVKTQAWRCDRPGELDPLLIIRWPKQGGRDCFEPIGSDDACRVTGASFDDGGSPALAVDQDRCTCRARGQQCRRFNPDGGAGILIDFARTYDSMSAPFVGAGCTRTPCEAAAGEPDLALADECR